MSAATSSPLDLRGPLPSGTVVLEASAGTGKTYAIAALATRAVAEGVCELPQLLIVTFTRAATAELRERVRQRLVGAEQHLRRQLAGLAPDPGDDLILAHLADAPEAELRERHARLATAVTDFDAATISTIHGFTQQVLRSVGFAADVPRELTLLEDSGPLLDEVVDDVYVRRYLGEAFRPGRPKRDKLRTLAELVARHPDATIHPDPDREVWATDGAEVAEDAATELAACARELRTAIAERKRRDGTLSYDDLLHALRDALRDPERGAQARTVLRDRYRWALIDEFQDTDPVQWDILRDAFTDARDARRALVLIGDPKQAIYSFRGADVRAYLEAVTTADQRRDLAVNHRSDGVLLGALDRLLTGVRFGDHDIRFRPVEAARPHRDLTVGDDADDAALQVRPYVPSDGDPKAPAVRAAIARDLAATLLDQLGRVTIGADRRTLRPGDVAVLVRTNDEARLVQAQLREVGLPSVVNGVGSVLGAEAADDWRWLIEAVERPSDPGRIRRLALSRWIGWRAEDLAAADDDAFDDLHDDAARWGALLSDHGVATLERTVLAERRVAARLLAELGGERHLTDLRHVGRLLHVAEREEDRGVSSLRAWLFAARAEAGRTTVPSDEQARRLESDAEAVQIVTVHRSKGLQYLVVCVPFSWSPGQAPSFPLALHDPELGGRVLDVGPGARVDAGLHRDLAKREQLGEQLRLLYVAVTRARHRVVLWHSPTKDAAGSALGRVLVRDEDGTVDLDGTRTPPADLVTTLRERFAGTATSVTPVTDDGDGEIGTWDGGGGTAPDLDAARFDRPLDRAWRRTSYTGWTRLATATGPADGSGPAPHGGAGPTAPDGAAAPTSPVGTEPEVVGKDDEPAEVEATAPTFAPDGADGDADGGGADGRGDGSADLDRPLPLGGLRGGTAFGVLVHAVLEHVDLASDDLPAALHRELVEQRRRHRVTTLTDDDLPTLVEGLVAAIATPLGPLTAGPGGRPLRLADLTRADRLDELEFELPLAGGDDARPGDRAATLAAVADLLDRPPAAGGLADDDPLRAVGYADRLRAPGFHLDVRGYLTGSIDLVLRTVGHDGAPRYLVADHKTNRLGGPEPTVAAYAPAALIDAMVDHDYPLQALLYQVALHRYLRWRQPGYDPAVHLGGALYLFLRGMVGPDTPHLDGQPCGVVAWHPPGALIADVSDVLDGRVPATHDRQVPA